MRKERGWRDARISATACAALLGAELSVGGISGGRSWTLLGGAAPNQYEMNKLFLIYAEGSLSYFENTHQEKGARNRSLEGVEAESAFAASLSPPPFALFLRRLMWCTWNPGRMRCPAACPQCETLGSVRVFPLPTVGSEYPVLEVAVELWT